MWLLSLTVIASMVNISQRSSSNEATSSPTTIALSATLFAGVALLLVALPAAFFRAKLQDGREVAQLRKVRLRAMLVAACWLATFTSLEIRPAATL